MMNNKSKITETLLKPRGYVEIWQDVDTENEQLVGKSNLVLDNFYPFNITLLREGLANLRYIKEIHLGVGGHAIGDYTTPLPPQPTDTALEDFLFGQDIVGRLSANPLEVEFNTTFAKPDGNPPLAPPDSTHITEAGLILDDGTLVARVTFSGIRKTTDVTLTLRWFLNYTL